MPRLAPQPQVVEQAEAAQAVVGPEEVAQEVPEREDQAVAVQEDQVVVTAQGAVVEAGEVAPADRVEDLK